MSDVEPIKGFTSLPGCHCVTASFRKVCAFNGYAVSEEMLFGLGAGAGFVYWHQKGQYPILGGRGNTKGFHQDLSRRTGIVIEEHRTSSAKVAEREMVTLLENCWFTFDFGKARAPARQDVRDAIAQCANDMLSPPIQNLGVAGIRTAAMRVKQWPVIFDETQLRMALWNLYVFTEIGGSGGGLFRFMYALFLEEAAAVTGDARYTVAARAMLACAEGWRTLAAPLAAALESAEPSALAPGVVDGLEELHK